MLPPPGRPQVSWPWIKGSLQATWRRPGTSALCSARLLCPWSPWLDWLGHPHWSLEAPRCMQGFRASSCGRSPRREGGAGTLPCGLGPPVLGAVLCAFCQSLAHSCPGTQGLPLDQALKGFAEGHVVGRGGWHPDPAGGHGWRPEGVLPFQTEAMARLGVPRGCISVLEGNPLGE